MLFQIGQSVNAVGESRGNASPVLLLQGEFLKTVHTAKVAVDLTVIEAGSSVLEGLDRLYKTLWNFDLEYNDKSACFFMFVQSLYNMKFGSVPPTVKQLRSLVGKS